ncbi:MAG TPA: hypothetical protein VD865_04375 [Stenotrophomonas sp.]|nr:hypothetical protein [Stenotrophomonas sp.]
MEGLRNVADEVAREFEKTLSGGYDIYKVSETALRIYMNYCLELTESVHRAVLVLMAMQEGPEFELNESEFRELIEKIKAI